MRIIYFSGAYIPSRGANAVHAMHQCSALAELGHDVTLIARKGKQNGGVYAYYGVKLKFKVKLIDRPQIRIFGAFWWAWQASNWVIRNLPEPDLVYSREVWALSLFTLQSPATFIHEKHWTVYGFEKLTEKWLLGRATCAGFVYISQALKRIYSNSVPEASDKMYCVAHDAARDRMKPPPPKRIGPMHVGYVGSFRDGYGIETIVSLAKALRHIRFTVVGGSASDINNILNSTNAKGLDNLTFAGFVAPSKLSNFYSEFDITLAPYNERTDHIDWISPMKLFEYMAHGRGVLCSDFPVMREIITPGLNGYLLPPNNLIAWMDRLNELDKNPEQCVKLGNDAFAEFKEKHTWRHRGERILRTLVPHLTQERSI